MTRDEIIQKIQSSKSYKALYPKTIERVVDEAIRKNPDYAINTAKNELHRIWGAFYSRRPRFQKLLKKLKNDDRGREEILLELLKIHSSTSERIPFLNTFYRKIFAVTGKPKTMVDVGCGFNPLCLPWMELDGDTTYFFYDIDMEQMDFLSKVYKLFFNNQATGMGVKDILADEIINADVVFLLKIIPVLEQQSPGITLRIFEKFKDSEYLVVSFPTKSLSGREVGMSDFYSKQFEDIIESGLKMEDGGSKLGVRSWEIVKKIEFGNELVYIVAKNNKL